MRSQDRTDRDVTSSPDNQPGGSGHGRAIYQSPRVRRKQMKRSERAAEAVLMLGLMRAAEQEHPHNIYEQLASVWSKAAVPSIIGRPRTASMRTHQKYHEVLTVSLHDLAAMNIHPVCISGLTFKHLRRLFRWWEEKGLSPSTFQSRMTVLRRYFGWIGKSDVPTLHDLLQDPTRAQRSSIPLEAKSWASKGVDPELAFKQMATHCLATSMHMKMEHYLGLRREEALQMNLHDFGDGSSRLAVTRGTKGGRARDLKLDDAGRSVLAEARAMADKTTGRVQYAKNITLEQAINHYKYMMRKLGFTKKDRGVTGHGLRHSFSANRYTKKTGELPPILSGAVLDPDVDQMARGEISQELGHVRTYITNTYLGPSSQSVLTEQQTRRLRSIVRILEGEGTPFWRMFWEASEIAGAAGCKFSLYITGEHAKGNIVLSVTSPTLICAFALERHTVPSRRPENAEKAAAYFGSFPRLMVPRMARLLSARVSVVTCDQVDEHTWSDRYQILPVEPTSVSP